jgi:hypothetical protein
LIRNRAWLKIIKHQAFAGLKRDLQKPGKMHKHAKEEGLPFYLRDFKCWPGFEKECVRKD